jgi:hypothetical protein
MHGNLRQSFHIHISENYIDPTLFTILKSDMHPTVIGNPADHKKVGHSGYFGDGRIIGAWSRPHKNVPR